jgi:hypothetical protein
MGFFGREREVLMTGVSLGSVGKSDIYFDSICSSKCYCLLLSTFTLFVCC